MIKYFDKIFNHIIFIIIFIGEFKNGEKNGKGKYLTLNGYLFLKVCLEMGKKMELII